MFIVAVQVISTMIAMSFSQVTNLRRLAQVDSLMVPHAARHPLPERRMMKMWKESSNRLDL
jgi:hypothetical protein